MLIDIRAKKGLETRLLDISDRIEMFWICIVAATVVASYEIDQYVYYFFREIASEASGMGTVRYSRVSRVCKVCFYLVHLQSKWSFFSPVDDNLISVAVLSRRARI